MHFYYSMDEWELYDLKQIQMKCIISIQKAPEELIDSLKNELEALRKKYKDDGSIEQMKIMTDTVIQEFTTSLIKL
ncbi:MAG: hypothetical protein CM15mP23_09730 [Cryomorphaceae bacterium]|nr:MAG: hypothetical protein CM15mP23_09730 [Cryomorphaceae bacterium]